MDSKRFDDLAKASGGTRRGVLRALAAGTLGAAFGVPAFGAAARPREVSTTAYDLTCRQPGTVQFCQSGAPGTSCKSLTSGCVCAVTKEGRSKCIEQPSGGCPKKKEKCRKNKDCAAGEVCVNFPACCSNAPARGKCVKECPL